ncbi:MAG TPA: SGNH/GDSL hydrolase family protein [Candidatus Dormibacteraeota bacterium]
MTALRYLALGDSYTIGTGASSESHNYPSILAARLSQTAGAPVAVTNPAINGFTTQDLIDNELAFVSKLKPELVTILIGVNDIVQGRSLRQYGETLAAIYDRVGALELMPGRVVAISIPNWSVAPAAAGFGDAGRLRRLTDEFNALAQRDAEARGFLWVDITEVSTSRHGTPGWISSDQLHPGDIQYAAWADVIWKAVREPWTAAAAARP